MEPVAAALPPRLILYDGICRFCNRAVQWLLRVDQRGRFHFAPLQGPTAATLRARHPEIPTDTDSMLYVDSSDSEERVYVRSQAAFQICRELEGRWRVLAGFAWLPRGLTDFAYDTFARSRYRLFGKLDTCPVPSPEQRARFLP
jgi:predicted DCC family thiol-disulfide oxidoreductase YuxK